MNNKFDNAAENWDKKSPRIEMAAKFSNEIKTLISEEAYKKAFEYGCGTGNVSFNLKDCFEEFTLADASKGMLEQVKIKINTIGINHFTPRILDLEQSTIKDKFDIIYTLMTMHHVVNIEKVIKEFSKMLLPNGLLIIGDLVKEDGNFHPYPENQNVHFGFEEEYFKQIFEKNNLKQTEYKIFHEMERDHAGTLKKYPLFIQCAKK